MSEPLHVVTVRICVEADDDAGRIAAVLVALGYKVERDMTLAGGSQRVGWAAVEIASKYRLTERERYFVQKLFAGETLDAIAQQFDMSKATAKWNMHNVYTKTGTNSVADLLLLGIRALAGE
jgi:DNA-binding CsgD family transcriptional regulator